MTSWCQLPLFPSGTWWRECFHNITPRSLESFTPHGQGTFRLSCGDFSLDRCWRLKFVGGTKGPAILGLYIEVIFELQVSRCKTRKQPEATGLARDNFQEYKFQVSTGQGSAMNAATPHVASAWVVKHKFIKKRSDDFQSTSCHKWSNILFNPLKYDKKIPCQTSCQILKV